MAVRFSNNAFATLGSSLTNVATTLSLSAGQGARFPSLGAGDYFFATIVDASNNQEIVKVTARSTDTLTIVRAQDGTSARAFNAGDRIELRVTAASLNALQDYAPSGSVSSNTVAGAIAELDSEKAPINSPAFTGTPTAPTAAAGNNSTLLATTAFVSDAVSTRIPAGVIVMWSGSTSAVPAGWFLCNGSNGTPDLRDRFVVGAGSSYGVGATGGSKDATLVEHTHTGTTATNGDHAHTYINPQLPSAGSTSYQNGPQGTTWRTENIAQGNTGTAGSHNHTFTTNSSGSSATNANLPPYYALAYIMKG